VVTGVYDDLLRLQPSISTMAGRTSLGAVKSVI